MRPALVAGNWKMNGSAASIQALLAELVEHAQGVETVVCPPAVYLAQVAQAIAGSPLKLGAQNVSEHASGAFTGEISVAMLQDFGCEYVILGHSERRALYGEQDAAVAAKFAAVKAAGLRPILCVGETLEQREAGRTLAVVSAQVAAVLEMQGDAAFAQAVIAYEPVWAIGTGRTATPEQAQEVHAVIRAQVAASNAAVAERLQILYGGSVNAGNAEALFGQADIDGGLIGGASLKAEEFTAICRAAAG